MSASEPAVKNDLILFGRFYLLYGDCHKDAWLVTYGSRDMALTGSIVCEKDIAGTEAPLGAIADLDLTFT
jgi:hypothetical protein